MLKGALLFLSIFLFTFVTISLLEFLGRFNQTIRSVFFYGFVFGNIYIFINYILIPIFKLNKVGKRLSLNQASEMIGSLFPDVSDKLQNTLQLNAQLESKDQNIDLIKASINQRSANLSSIPFVRGIDLGENKRYLKYLLPVLILIIAVAIIKPNVFSDGSKRIINYSTEYVEEAPFQFSFVGKDSIMQGQAYTLKVTLNGKEIPNEVKISTNIGTYNLEKENAVTFTHHFTSINDDVTFQCEANGFKSETFKLNVLQRPNIEQVRIKLNYPKHTGMAPIELNDLSDITVPEGTVVNWEIISKNTSQIKLRMNDTTVVKKPSSNQEFNFEKGFKSSADYQFLLSTNKINDADTLNNHLTVIADTYPTIVVSEENDSTNSLRRFFSGTVSDDYGFSKLKMVGKISKEDSSYTMHERIDINLTNTKQDFVHFIDLSKFDLSPGDQLEYFFVISDNDAPNGYKSANSTKYVFAVPEIHELEDALSDKSEQMKNDIDNALKDSKKLKESITDLKNNLINKKAPDWKDKQSIQNMLNLQQNMQEQLNQLQKQFDENTNEENEFLELSDELLKKQELLEELMAELLDEEMLQLLEELQKMMDDMNKDELLQNMEEMEQKSESLEKELDRTLELFKHMELDKKIENIEEQLRELAEQQKDLQEKTQEKKMSSEELKEKQEELNEKFEDIENDIEEAKKMNEELEEPENLEFSEEDQAAIEEEMSESEESLSEGKEKKASESQSKAAEMLEQMADDIQAMQQSASTQQNSEDMEQLRFLLENIVTLSHDQEFLLDDYSVVSGTNPILVDYNQKQIELSKSSEIVRDSLEALAKRQAQLSNTIIEELADLTYNMSKSIEFGEERRIDKVKQHQQYSITTLNDLALLLSEVLAQMQAQAQSQMPGSGSCDKPGGSGGGKPSNKMSMQQMKDQLKKQMDKMKNGQNPGGQDGKKPGEGQGMGGGKIPGLSNKDIAKMALEQGEMRRALQQLRQELNKDGSGLGNELNKVIDDMEKLEDDLLNNGFTNDAFKRQQDIMTRLLESEKAILERGYSEERESKSAKKVDEGNQIKIIEYNRKKEGEIELLRSIPIGLRVYYKGMINDYFNTVNN